MHQWILLRVFMRKKLRRYMFWMKINEIYFKSTKGWKTIKLVYSVPLEKYISFDLVAQNINMQHTYDTNIFINTQQYASRFMEKGWLFLTWQTSTRNRQKLDFFELESHKLEISNYIDLYCFIKLADVNNLVRLARLVRRGTLLCWFFQKFNNLHFYTKTEFAYIGINN
jgi:hypothetical protein